MQMRVKDDSIEIDGYVNAVERKSRPLRSRMGQFVERICKGAYGVVGWFEFDSKVIDEQQIAKLVMA